MIIYDEMYLDIYFYVQQYNMELYQYSRIPLSRVPLTRENQLVALVPWTPNFSDSSLAAAHMSHDGASDPHVLKWANFSTRPFITGDMTTLSVTAITHPLGHVG